MDGPGFCYSRLLIYQLPTHNTKRFVSSTVQQKICELYSKRFVSSITARAVLLSPPFCRLNRWQLYLEAAVRGEGGDSNSERDLQLFICFAY